MPRNPSAAARISAPRAASLPGNTQSLIDRAQAQGIAVVQVFHREPGRGRRQPLHGCVRSGARACRAVAAPGWRCSTRRSTRPCSPVPPTARRSSAGCAARGIDALLVTGIRTEQCCETTTRHASDLGFSVRYVTDATLTFPMQHPRRAQGQPRRRSASAPSWCSTDASREIVSSAGGARHSAVPAAMDAPRDVFFVLLPKRGAAGRRRPRRCVPQRRGAAARQLPAALRGAAVAAAGRRRPEPVRPRAAADAARARLARSPHRGHRRCASTRRIAAAQRVLQWLRSGAVRESLLMCVCAGQRAGRVRRAARRPRLHDPSRAPGGTAPRRPRRAGPGQPHLRRGRHGVHQRRRHRWPRPRAARHRPAAGRARGGQRRARPGCVPAPRRQRSGAFAVGHAPQPPAPGRAPRAGRGRRATRPRAGVRASSPRSPAPARATSRACSPSTPTARRSTTCS